MRSWVIIAAVTLLLLAGCSAPPSDTEVLREWAKSLSDGSGALDVELRQPEDDPSKVTISATMRDAAQAREFYRKAMSSLQEQQLDPVLNLKLTWPVSGGPSTLLTTSRAELPGAAWEWADAPLPQSATSREAGFFHRWGFDFSYESTDVVATLLDAPLHSGTSVEAKARGLFAGPFEASEVRARAEDLRTVAASIESLDEATITLKAGVGVAAILPRLTQPWTLLSGSGTWRPDGKPEDALFDALTAAETEVTATSAGLDLRASGEAACRAGLERVPPEHEVGLTCSFLEHPAPPVRIRGNAADLSTKLPALANLIERGATAIETTPTELTVNLGTAPHQTWRETLSVVRELMGPGEQTITLTGDMSEVEPRKPRLGSVRFTSTASGKATGETFDGDERPGRLLVTSWNESKA